MNVNEIIQTACEDLDLVGEGQPVDGDLAACAEKRLNMAISELNADSFIAQCVKSIDVTAVGRIQFKKLEPGESNPGGVVDMEPPENVSGVSRKVGIRWMRLIGATTQDLSTFATMSLPQLYSYQIESETAPSGDIRQVGVVHTNGMNPVQFRVFVSNQMPQYKLGDKIYLPDLYRNLIVYALEEKLVERFKLYSYKAGVQEQLTKIKDSMDKNRLVNSPELAAQMGVGGYSDDFYNGLNGVGM